MNETRRSLVYVAAFLIIGGALALAGSLYRAHVQADVYRRQGVEMSTWEVFCGAQPAERAIKDAK